MSTAHRNRGVALITALLVVALATTAAVTLASNMQLHIRRSGNLVDGDQAALYAKAAEGWAKTILSADLKDNDTDDRDDLWATKLPVPIDLPGGFVFGQIEDLQGRFNVNDLLDARHGQNQQQADNQNQQNQDQDQNQNGQTGGNQQASNPNAYLRFQALLNNLDLDPKLADTVVDWIDADINEGQDGAEDNYYTGLEVPYLAANQPMLDITELRLVKGFEVILDEETGETVYDKILPHVTALPQRPSKINVNFATPAVLASLSPAIDMDLARELYRDPANADDKPPFDDEGQFTQEIPLSDDFKEGNKQALEQLITVASEYFLATAESTIGNGRATFTSILRRARPTEIKTVYRGQTTQ
ncbi:MAG: type II secretion system minor pseudopilin GspK [Gammaproteobacteria bacterium]